MDGCIDCHSFLETYIPATGVKKSKSVKKLLVEAMVELFAAIAVDKLMIDDEYPVSSVSFIRDFLKLTDEINSATDLVEIWHIDYAIANQIYSLFTEVICGVSTDTDRSDVVSVEQIDEIDKHMHLYDSNSSDSDDSDESDANCES